ncbi:hypothetical protein N656DRAFT_802101 [Canariomyces notabilis]|uniref:Uncharacterized protein n=1 Tax=Canariomyces notabilis TaxID=2074819 RepID=A0AAN6QD86_9PEZI|nr:hypothetical protein N656DRAFT_802101 [Canariomyces arenarius]
MNSTARPDDLLLSTNMYEGYKTTMRYVGQTHQILLEDATGMAEYGGILQRTYKRADVVLICAEDGSHADFTELQEVWLRKMPYRSANQMLAVVCVRDEESDQKKSLTTEVSDWAKYQYAGAVANMLGVDNHMVCDLRNFRDVEKVFYKVWHILLLF